jgi:hypothetical protein
MIRTIPAVKTLTDQQKYLLNRIPNGYDLRKLKDQTDPPEVRRARKLVARWDDKQRKASCKHECKVKKLITSAREAVYFKPIKSALQAVKAVEAMKTCCDN